MQLPDYCYSPRLARDALVLRPSAALNRDPTSVTGVNNSSLCRWQRELLPLKGHQQGPSTSQSEPYLRNGAEKIWGLLHSLCETSLKLFHVSALRSKQAPFDR